MGEPQPSQVQIQRVSAAPLESGLSDYFYWVQLFAENPPAPVPPGRFRRGRIWA